MEPHGSLINRHCLTKGEGNALNGGGIDNDQGGQGCKWRANLLYTPFGGGLLFTYLTDSIK
ncbi:hypothetical protein AH448_15240 [Salmonella enterica subsp. diarizonae]|nr:hypothetical protein [Salmonella enterica subsp. diarizonae]